MKFWFGSGSADPYLWLIDPDADADPAIFVNDFLDVNKNFCLLLFEVTFTSFCKNKKSKRSQKTVGIKVFHKILAWWLKDPDPYLWLIIRIWEAQKHGDPTDQDPQHWPQPYSPASSNHKRVLVLMLTLSNKTSSVVPRPPRRCKLDRDCGDPDACIMSLCTNPCLTSNPCDASAICKPFNKTAYCYCPEGHVGDPYIQCLLAPEPGK